MTISKMSKQELEHFLKEQRTELQTLSSRGSDLNSEDVERLNAIDADMAEAREKLAAIEARAAAVINDFASGNSAFEHGTPNQNTATRTASLKGRTILAKGESFRSWAEDNDMAERGTDLSLDKLLRGLATNDWRSADAERALTTTGSTALVPTPLATTLIDLARARAVVLQAGATVVPMTSKTLRVPRLLTEGAPQFYNEGQQRNAVDMTFDAVTLDAKTFDRLILISKELFEDSSPEAGKVIEEAFAAQFAVGIDKFALFGDGVAPNPLGLVNTSFVPKVAHGANGTAVSNYDWLIQAAGAVAAQNFTPTAQIASPRTATALQLLKNSQGDYLQAPQGLPTGFVTSGIPNNLTVGTSNDTSVIITGQFDQLLLGLRSDFSLTVLTERYADTGQVAFLASSRWDVAVAQPLAFQIDQGVK